MRYVWTALCLFFVTACSESPTAPTVPLNREFVLAPGSSAMLEEPALSIRFDGVTGDSRCPADAICIQGGDAVVTLTATSIKGTRVHELHTGTMAPVQHDEVLISLVRLEPYPFSSGPIAPDDYRATLRVTQ